MGGDVQYIVVEKMNIYELESSVTTLLKEGWILQGGVSFVFAKEYSEKFFIQAMLRVQD